mgnify:CR=1 FL=1
MKAIEKLYAGQLIKLGLDLEKLRNKCFNGSNVGNQVTLTI